MSCSKNQHCRCDIDDTMMRQWWVRDYDGWSSTTDDFPPMLHTNQEFIKYEFIIHGMVCSSPARPSGGYSESDFWHRTGTSSCRCPLKGGHQWPRGPHGAGAEKRWSLCNTLYRIVGNLPYQGMLIIPSRCASHNVSTWRRTKTQTNIYVVGVSPSPTIRQQL